MNSRKGLLVVCLAGLLVVVGCSDRELRPLNPCTLSSVSNNVQVQNLDKVDLLFMIDNSNSMEPKQQLLREQFPRMVQGLLSGDPGNTGTQQFPQVASLRIGVVTSDMGIDGFPQDVDPSHTTGAVAPATPTCGGLPTMNVALEGTFDGSMTVSNVRVRWTDAVSRNILPTLTAPEVHDLVVGTKFTTSFPPNVGSATAATAPGAAPVPTGTTITEFTQSPTDPLSGTLTLSASATGNGTGTYVTTWAAPDPTHPRLLVSKARYGDDGLIYRSLNSHTAAGATIPNPLPPNAPINCDADGDGWDDVLQYGATADDQHMPHFLTYDQGGSVSVAQYLERISCVTNVGTGGCGFERQLESLLKAVQDGNTTPTGGPFYYPANDPTQASHGQGHGTDPATNGSWFRDDSLLAIVYVSDEDDCSASNPDVFNPGAMGSEDNGNPNAMPPDPNWQYNPANPYVRINARCAKHPEFLHSAQRYVDGFIAARNGDTTRLVFAAITGIPINLTDDIAAGEGSTNLGQILADPLMTSTFTDYKVGSTSYSWGLVNTACVNPTTNTFATPGRRAVEVAQGLQNAKDANGRATPVPVFVSSVCNDNFDDSVKAILTLISRQLAASCLPRALNPNSQGLVTCRVLEDLATTSDHCADLPGSEMTVSTTNGIETCQIHQLAVTGSGDGGTPAIASGDGWYYDNFSAQAQNCGTAQPQRISFTTKAQPPAGNRLHIECLQTVTGGGLAADINTACPGGDQTVCNMNLEQRQAFCLRYNLSQPGCSDVTQPNPLICEKQTNTCQIPCMGLGDDSACPGSFDCFNPYDPAQYICVNPTCGTNAQ